MIGTWTSDMAPGEHSSTVHARLQDTFADDPILAMFVPKMVSGLIRAVVAAVTVEERYGTDPRLVVPEGMTLAETYLRVVNVVEASPLSVLRAPARAHLAETVRDGLFPVTAARLAADIAQIRKERISA